MKPNEAGSKMKINQKNETFSPMDETNGISVQQKSTKRKPYKYKYLRLYVPTINTVVFQELNANIFSRN